MKKLKYIISLLAVVSIIILAGCKKESEKLSKITYYPIFNYNGDHFVSVPVGGSYTDPGVTATLDGKDFPVVKSGTVDFNTAGEYTITYTSTNPDGFPAYEYRYIGVITPGAAATDLSGSYTRSAASNVIVTKVADGLYLIDNVAGVDPTNPSLVAYVVEAYFFNTEGQTLIVPSQQTPVGFLSCVEGSINDNGFQWIVINSNYGTKPRIFVKN